MQLQQIEKTQYRKRLNVVIVSFILGFGALSVLYGSLLISLFSSVDMQVTTTDVEGKDNFKLNLIGVVLGLITSAAILHRMRNHPFFKEIYYVWQVKQIQNLIYRKLGNVKNAVKNGDVNAMITLDYYYKSLKQIYYLDDNTITLSTVEKEHQEYLKMFEEMNLSISAEKFDKSMLNKL